MLTVVVGGGISGLTCALELQRAGLKVLLLERSKRVGGVIESVRKDGFLFEAGPQSVLCSESLARLVSQLNLQQALLQAESRAPRYILLRRELHPVPTSPTALLRTSLLGARTKWRLLTEPLLHSQPIEPDESVADFVTRKFGREFLEHLVGPFLSGIYAGDPEKTSLRSAFPAIHAFEERYGSVIRGAFKSRKRGEQPRPTLCTLRDGLGTLTAALAGRLGDSIRTGSSVGVIRRIKTNGSWRYELQVEVDGRTEGITAAAVVMAAPTEAAAKALSALSRQFQDLLSRIEYAPLAVVSAGYRREQVGHPLDGFGFLVPRKEGLRLLGTIWSSSLFPERAPAGMVNLASFAGGATDPDLVQLQDEEIARNVGQEIRRILRVSGSPVTWLVHRHARAIPQYRLGHSQTIAALREEEARFPGLFLTGNYFEGPSVPTCIDHAARVAQAVQRYLAGNPPGPPPSEQG